MSAREILVYVLFPLAGYFLGSVPFAWVIGKAHGVDIRTVGSKNIGATNLGRVLGAKFFWQAFLLDAAKGFVPVLSVSLVVAAWRGPATPPPEGSAFEMLSKYLDVFSPNLPAWAPLLTAGACFLGHVFPIYLKFKGGKGVATSFGAVLGFWPIFTLAGILAGLFFVFMLMVYRYVSLASITAAAVFAALVAILAGGSHIPYVHTYLSMADRVPLIVVACFFAAVIIWRHRANIGRLIKGTESKVGAREVEIAKMAPHGDAAAPEANKAVVAGGTLAGAPRPPQPPPPGQPVSPGDKPT